MDRADVRRPVDGPRVEAELGLVVGREALPHRHQVVDLVDRLALGVQAVQLDVLERPLDLDALGLQAGGELGLLAAQRQRLEHLLAAVMSDFARWSWAWTRPRAGNRNSGTTIGWPSAS